MSCQSLANVLRVLPCDFNSLPSLKNSGRRVVRSEVCTLPSRPVSFSVYVIGTRSREQLT